MNEPIEAVMVPRAQPRTPAQLAVILNRIASDEFRAALRIVNQMAAVDEEILPHEIADLLRIPVDTLIGIVIAHEVAVSGRPKILMPGPELQ